MNQKHTAKKAIEAKKYMGRHSPNQPIPLFIPFNDGDAELIALAKNKKQADEIFKYFHKLPDDTPMPEARMKIHREFNTMLPLHQKPLK
jgi:hypothetical protein